jgi:hypothetical protein
MASVKPNELISSDWIGEKTDTIQWNSYTLGQNKKIAEIAAAAQKAGVLLNANMEFARVSITAAGLLVKAALSPQIILLNAVADEIDNFMSDFKNIGFYILEVGQPAAYGVPKMYDKDNGWGPVNLIIKAADITVAMAVASSKGLGLEVAGMMAETLAEENIRLTGPQKAEYKIPIGKSKQDWPAGFCSVPFTYHKTETECNAAHNQPITQRVAGSDVITGYTEHKDKWVKGSTYTLDPSGPPSPAPSEVNMAEPDGWSGLPKITPSQAIATMIGAIDDPGDSRRPIFSTSAEAGGIVLMIGVADLTKNLATIKDIFDAFITFFGGEKQGMLAGLGKLNDLIAAALAQKQHPEQNMVTLNVNTVCEMIGNTESLKFLKSRGALKTSVSGKANAANCHVGDDHIFSEGDFVLGPHDPSGKATSTLGVVTKVVEQGGEKAIYDDRGLATQILEITAISTQDAIRFKNSKGHKLTRVHYHEDSYDFIDRNSFGLISTDYQTFKWAEELTDEEAKKSAVKVSFEAAADGESPKPKQVGTGVDITEIHTVTAMQMGVNRDSSAFGIGSDEPVEQKSTYTTKNRLVGTIFEPAGEPIASTPPDFTSYKLEDILGGLDAFFSSVQGLTDGMRQLAKDVSKGIDDLIIYLDGKIEELEEINAALQKVLKIFSTGLPATGIYVLNIPVNVGGNEYIKSTLQGAAGRPPDSLDFTMSMFMMFGGPGKALQDLLIPE